MEEDFLGTEGQDFQTLEAFVDFIREEVDLGEINGDLNLVGSVSDFNSRSEFFESLEKSFEIVDRNENVVLLRSKKRDIPYYTFYDDEFPLFFTNARVTEDLPETLWNHMSREPNLGRLWVGKQQMEEIRQEVVEKHSDMIIPKFVAKRSKFSDIDAQKRPDYRRTFQYYGEDGLETFKELKYDYGVLPTSITFKKAGQFKFRISRKGVFTLNSGGLDESLKLIRKSIERLRTVKEAIDTSEYSEKQNKFASGDQKIPESKPWAIKLSSGLSEREALEFRENIQLNYWNFDVGQFQTKFNGHNHFSSVLVDEDNFGKLEIRTKDDSFRIYPREDVGIDEAMRIYEYVRDQIDPGATAIPVS